MSNPILWGREDHTAAKHRVLVTYLEGWLGVMANQALKVWGGKGVSQRLLLVDGFAGPGRYATGESGSPLLMLEALLGHKSRAKWDGIQFLYLFIERDPRRVARLRKEVERLGGLPANVTVKIEHGEFESAFGRLLDDVPKHGKTIIPTFAFIDPFGYSTSSMSVTGKLLEFPRCEVLFFLPLTFIRRFVSRSGQEAALTALFGCDDWRGAIPLEGDERSRFLLDLFERQLRANSSVVHVRSFQLRTQDGNDYRLVFGLGHDRGLDLAKDAMWNVDPISGTSYRATSLAGQEVLFSPTVDTGPLLADLRVRFGTEPFTMEDAERFTRIDSHFRVGHLRRMTLLPAEKAGKLEIERASATRGLGGARLRFRA